MSNTALLLLIISLSLVIYATTQKKIRDMPGLLILAATAWFALQHYRHLSLYAVVWICYSPAYIENTKLGDLIEKTYRHNQKKLAIFSLLSVLWELSLRCKRNFGNYEFQQQLRNEMRECQYTRQVL